MAQFLRPDSNITQTNFTNGFAEIDESAASDADFAWGANNASCVLEVGLSNPSGTPAAGTSTVRYRVAKVSAGTLNGTGATINITCHVYEGASLVASDSARTVTGTWTTYSFTPDMSGVSNWNDLRLRFTSNSSGAARGAAVSWAELEAPDGNTTQDLTPSLFTNSQTFHGPTVSATYALAPGLVTNSQTFHAATVAAGAVDLTPSLFTNTQTFHAATVSQAGGSQELTPSLFDNGSGTELVTNGTFDSATTGWTAGAGATLSAPSGRLRVTKSGAGNEHAYQAITTEIGRAYRATGNGFVGSANGYEFRVGTSVASQDYGAATNAALDLTFVATSTTAYITCRHNAGPITTYVEFDDVSLKPSPFYAPTVTRGAVTLAPSLFTNSNTFHAPTVSASYTLSPSLLTNTQAFHSATITVGAATLAPGIFANSQTFYSPTVAGGSADLFPPLYTNTQTFYSPALTYDQELEPALLTNTQNFYGASVFRSFDKHSSPTLVALDMAAAPSAGTFTKHDPPPVVDI